jgi:hypothetical protein
MPLHRWNFGWTLVWPAFSNGVSLVVGSLEPSLEWVGNLPPWYRQSHHYYFIRRPPSSSEPSIGSHVRTMKSNNNFFPPGPVTRRRGPDSGESPWFLPLDVPCGSWWHVSSTPPHVISTNHFMCQWHRHTLLGLLFHVGRWILPIVQCASGHYFIQGDD